MHIGIYEYLTSSQSLHCKNESIVIVISGYWECETGLFLQLRLTRSIHLIIRCDYILILSVSSLCSIEIPKNNFKNIFRLSLQKAPDVSEQTRPKATIACSFMRILLYSILKQEIPLMYADTRT